MKTEVSRRTFVKLIGGVGASLAVGSFASCAFADKKEKGAVFQPNAFVKIDPDGTVTVTISKSDMGQGVRTSLAMLVAEELDADWHKVRVVQAPSNPGLYGSQGTGGSGSVMGMNQKLRRLGATTRAMLVAAAAKTWACDPSACSTSAGMVLGPGGKSIPYGELTTVAATMPVPESVKLKDRSEFKIVGKATTRVDNPAVVTGQALYGIDAKVANMVYAVIARPPAFVAQLGDFDEAAARRCPAWSM